MTYFSRFSVIFLMSLCWFGLLQGCTAPSEAIKPIAQQNQQNIQALNKNISTLLTLYQPLLAAAGDALMYQSLAKTEQEMIAVVGSPFLSPPTEEETWQVLFERASNTAVGNRDKYIERYRFVRSAYDVNATTDLERLKYREGWIYQTVIDANFTPQRVHDILKALSTLRQNAGNDDANYYTQVELQLSPYDPSLQLKRQAIKGAEVIVNGLKQELMGELTTAGIHGQAFLTLGDSKIDATITTSSLVGELNNDQLMSVLDTVSSKYLQHPTVKAAAVEFLTGKLASLIEKL
ncbi:hypothetical protein [Beggiatoa leptomitoformis]|uniref:Lipoprotein n=1 Tax=Beggiatoa leptomitoformis TaxID=288004 RepID=A0A2N9YG46_9GAMM|nr:hypothetical protein [Beggiatoa leptomitoformis]ALG68222.1 hypothetical protein AL038_11490 [Beggiatoa leptomitoformis]AUI69474.1 hypothetical protein BLE401_12785 [Beggiatoa leptomitoformis]